MKIQKKLSNLSVSSLPLLSPPPSSLLPLESPQFEASGKSILLEILFHFANLHCLFVLLHFIFSLLIRWQTWIQIITFSNDSKYSRLQSIVDSLPSPPTVPQSKSALLALPPPTSNPPPLPSPHDISIKSVIDQSFNLIYRTSCSSSFSSIGRDFSSIVVWSRLVNVPVVAAEAAGWYFWEWFIEWME